MFINKVVMYQGIIIIFSWKQWGKSGKNSIRISSSWPGSKMVPLEFESDMTLPCWNARCILMKLVLVLEDLI